MLTSKNMENGQITLIASTTENPYFYVYGALLSRSTVFEFKSVSPEEVLPAVERALEIEKMRQELPLSWEKDVPLDIATACGGDVRKAINAVELLCQSARPNKSGKLKLTREDASQVSQRSAMFSRPFRTSSHQPRLSATYLSAYSFLHRLCGIQLLW